MLTRLLLPAALLTLAASIAGCNAPPSVQKVIDEKTAEQDAASAITIIDPVVIAAREDGREVYMRYLIGQWGAAGTCGQDIAQWEFTQDSFTRPDERPCRLEVIESLQDGSYAIAGYCPRLELEDEPAVVVFTRAGTDSIIIPGPKGGPLEKC